MNWNMKSEIYLLNSTLLFHILACTLCVFVLPANSSRLHGIIVLVVHVCQYMAVCGFLAGGFFFCQYWFWMVTASMETEMCFVDVISLKLFAPELYLKNIILSTLKVCLHVTKFSPSPIFGLILFYIGVFRHSQFLSIFG